MWEEVKACVQYMMVCTQSILNMGVMKAYTHDLVPKKEIGDTQGKTTTHVVRHQKDYYTCSEVVSVTFSKV